MERDLGAPVDRQDIGTLWTSRTRGTCSAATWARSRLGLAGRFRLDVDDDIRLRKRPPDGILDGVGSGVTLARQPRRETPMTTSTKAPSAAWRSRRRQSNARHVHANRAARRFLSHPAGARSMRTSPLRRMSLPAAAADEDCDEQWATSHPGASRAQPPSIHRERPVSRRGRCRSGALRAAPRSSSVAGQSAARRPARQIDGDDGDDDRKRPPCRIHLRLDVTGEPQHREERHAQLRR